MSEAKLTHCPHCHATFKVHDQQLNVAQGKVRCGSCLKVFNALEHLVDNQDYIPVAREQYKPEEEISLAITKPTPKAHETSRSNDTEDENELLFQDDPNEDNEEESYSGKGSFTGELDTTFINIDPNENKPSHKFSDAIDDDTTESFGANDESWALKMLEDDDDDESKITSKPESHGASKSQQRTADTSSDDIDFSDEFIDLDNSHTPSTPPRTNTPPHFSANEDADPVTGEEAPSPFDELYSASSSSQHYEQGERGFLGTLIWSLVNASLLIVMMGQLAWFHYDKLIQYKPAKTAFTKVCALLKCELPELIDTNLIKSRNLIVRSHPTLPKALIIDAIITNQASFNQPFPDMALYFSNLNNEIVAQRLFKPNEYLAGDVASWKTFPSNTPIHISLEIYDPGANAVNYKVMFYRHTEPVQLKALKKQ